jgi:hypothetical protein
MSAAASNTVTRQRKVNAGSPWRIIAIFIAIVPADISAQILRGKNGIERAIAGHRAAPQK